MSLLKNRPKCGKTIFVNINVYHGKNSPRIWATFVFLKTGQNNHPIGKNLPNLVTLNACQAMHKYL
jgi:hypothetical protein